MPPELAQDLISYCVCACRPTAATELLVKRVASAVLDVEIRAVRVGLERPEQKRVVLLEVARRDAVRLHELIPDATAVPPPSADVTVFRVVCGSI